MNTNDSNTNDSNDMNRPLDPNGKDDSIGRENFGCDAFAEALSLFVFGEAAELDDARRGALERHLVSCAACRSERDALLRSLELLKSESLRDAAPQLSAERQANLMEEAKAQSQANATGGAEAPAIAVARVVRIGRWAIAAGLIAAAGAGWYAWRKTGRDLEQFVAVSARRVEREQRSAAPAGAPATSGSEVDGGRGTFISGEYADSVPPPRPADRSGLDYEPNPSPDPAAAPVNPAAPAPAERVLAAKDVEELKKALGEALGYREAEEEVLTGKAELDPKGQKLMRIRGEELPVSGTPKTQPSGDLRGRSGGAAAPSGPPTAGDGRDTASPARRVKTSEAARGGGNAPATDPSNTPPPAAPLTSSGGASACMPPGSAGWGFPNVLYDTPDIAANTTTDYETALQWAKADEETLELGRAQLATWSGGDGGGDLSQSEGLMKLGYMADDNAGGGGNAPARLDPAMAGRLLAASCSPDDVVRFQTHLAAALGIDPAAPRADVEKDRDTIVREFLDRLSRRPSEPPRDMFFRYFGDHPFVSTRIDCKSTFGMDVDTASYALARAYLAKAMLPPKAAVRTEEFVNAFRHDLAPPSDDVGRDDDRDGNRRDGASRDQFAIHTEIAPSPFGDDRQLLLQVGLKARVIPKAQRKPVALTFIIDVSGSMAQDGRLELVKKALHLLVNQLDERDTIGIVSFESTGHRVLDPTNAANRDRIFGALDQLRPEGSTNADQGLRLGYDMALEQWRSSAENRVVLCSDGVANTGVTDGKVLSARIAECKSKYIYLNCVGVGMGNHNDALMEQLADEGDGFCAYLDRLEEAKKLFVDRLTGTLLTVARNAKIQVEFDPTSVRRFRQIGYEKRALAHRDFRNDRVDAGEVGAGQEVVALYEIEPKADAAGPLATVRIRYEDPEKGEVREQARQVFAAEVAPTLAKTTPRFRLSASVAEFAEILRQSVHARDGSFGAIARLAEPLVDELPGDADVPEFVALVQQAARLPDLLPPYSSMVRCVDELKKLRCWREEQRDAQGDADDELMRQLEEQNRRLEKALRDALDKALRHS